MARIAVRRASTTPSTPLAGAIALGLGLGALLGFLLGELAGPAAHRVLWGPGTPGTRARPLVARLVSEAQAALDDDLLLRECRLQVVAAGPGRIELHGWVGDRRSRARAAHLISDAVPAAAIINCLLVRGEDDLDVPGDDAPDARLA